MRHLVLRQLIDQQQQLCRRGVKRSHLSYPPPTFPRARHADHQGGLMAIQMVVPANVQGKAASARMFERECREMKREGQQAFVGWTNTLRQTARWVRMASSIGMVRGEW